MLKTSTFVRYFSSS
jgi:3-oxoacid CoA-transferase subunit A